MNKNAETLHKNWYPRWAADKRMGVLKAHIRELETVVQQADLVYDIIVTTPLKDCLDKEEIEDVYRLARLLAALDE